MTLISMKNAICSFPILFLIIVASLPHISCSNDTNVEVSTPSNHLMEGWNAYDSGDFTQAILNFERALNANPELADAHNGVGWSNLSLGLPLSLAQEAFQTAIRIDASNGDAWVGLANVLYLRQKDRTDFESALLAIDNALQGEKQFLYRHDYNAESDLYALKACCYFYLGDIQKANQEIEHVLRLDKENKTAILLQRLIKNH